MTAGELTAELERALVLCHRELNRRERTVAQLRRRLERSEAAPATVDAALAWLVEHRQVDDAGYAERFAADRRHLDGWGSERIRRRLEVDGVDCELIEAALAGRGTEQEMDAARALLATRFRCASGDQGDRRRALGLLVRRGYALELAGEAVRGHFGPFAD